jgi:hypothetical protein
MDSYENETQMLAQASEALRSRLHELQEIAHYNAYCVRMPDKWLGVATDIFQGKSVTGTMKRRGISQQTYYVVRKQIYDIMDHYKSIQIDALDANMDAINDISARELERVTKSGGLDLDTAKAIKELNVAGQIMAQRRHKLSDGADKVVRIEQAKTPEELAEELEAMFKEQAIEIEAEVVEHE